MNELRLTASTENLEKVQEFIEGELEAAGASMKVISQMDIVVEEIFVNIAHYAYAPDSGDAVIGCEILPDEGMARICFTDWGKPFNPLARDDADITLPAEERQIGGLGIYMAKKMTDRQEYNCEEHKNMFTIWKKI